MNRQLHKKFFCGHFKYFNIERVNQELFRLKLRKWDFSSIKNGFRILGSFLAKETGPIFAQRACRSYQILQLHSTLWASSSKNASAKLNSRRWFLGLVLISLCDQKVDEKNGRNGKEGGAIKKSELIAHIRDLDFIHDLTAATVICPDCKDRLVVDKKVANVKYCHCPNSTPAYKKISDYPWVPFVETPDLLIWRKPHDTLPGLYVYKVYGYYDDISPADFLETQLDLKYRKKWDNSVLKLNVVESDEESKVEIVHWEMQWPRMFSNRDYCFARRHLVNEKEGEMVIMSRAVEHSKVPEASGVVRVKEYWSVMHIKGVKGLDKPGVEFGLTYYDNPGLSLPGWMQNWAAMSAIPDFLNKVRNAARARKSAEGKRIYLYSHHQSREREASSPESFNQSSSQTSSEILSQFFKENILESSLNEVEA